MPFFDTKDEVINNQEVGETFNEHAPVKQSDDDQKLDEIEVCKKEVAQWKDRYMRTRADFDNFSRRVEKESMQVTLYAQLILTVLLKSIKNMT
jgi:molecular chaperone GrpE (heat shock protein)